MYKKRHQGQVLPKKSEYVFGSVKYVMIIPLPQNFQENKKLHIL